MAVRRYNLDLVRPPYSVLDVVVEGVFEGAWTVDEEGALERTRQKKVDTAHKLC
jgi:hypothetical protein